ncbi:MAG: L-threonylcarbamoyladenylate synthase [Spirochaetota bacterium]
MVIKKSNFNSKKITLSVLKSGGVVILPCDTIYGFHGKASVTERKIRKIKGSGELKPFLRLLANPSELLKYSTVKPDPRLLAFWPGPLTLVVPDRSGSTTAFRVPEDPFLGALLAELDEPLLSSSVNRSGTEPLWQVEKIIKEFEGEVDLIVEDGDLPGKLPSTILDISVTPYRIIRPGALRLPDELF